MEQQAREQAREHRAQPSAPMVDLVEVDSSDDEVQCKCPMIVLISPLPKVEEVQNVRECPYRISDPGDEVTATKVPEACPREGQVGLIVLHRNRLAEVSGHKCLAILIG